MVAARRLADMPSDRCTPQYVVDEAQKLCAPSPPCGVKCLMKSKLLNRDWGFCMPSVKARPCPPRLLAIHYNGIADGPVRCYVGKGITFDTGGLWLKEGAGMYTMKYDMCGAANVLGLMLSVAELGLPVRIMGVLALAENAIGPDAMQPARWPAPATVSRLKSTIPMPKAGWYWRMRSPGASQRHPQARYIIDMATLTGAVVKALGYELSGLMTQDEALRPGAHPRGETER